MCVLSASHTHLGHIVSSRGIPKPGQAMAIIRVVHTAQVQDGCHNAPQRLGARQHHMTSHEVT